MTIEFPYLEYPDASQIFRRQQVGSGRRRTMGNQYTPANVVLSGVVVSCVDSFCSCSLPCRGLFCWLLMISAHLPRLESCTGGPSASDPLANTLMCEMSKYSMTIVQGIRQV